MFCSSYPAQEHVGGHPKIPTVIYYDQDGNVRAIGAEALREGIEEDAEDSEWTKAEWQSVAPFSPSVWLIEKLGSSFTCVLTPNQVAMPPTRSHLFPEESPLLTFSLTSYNTSISVLELL